jgi:hypothetical protein
LPLWYLSDGDRCDDGHDPGDDDDDGVLACHGDMEAVGALARLHRDARYIGDRLGVNHVDRSDGPGDAAVDRPRVRRDAEIVEDLGVLLDDLLKRFARGLSRLMHGGADRWQHHQHKRVPGVEYGHEAGVNEG